MQLECSYLIFDLLFDFIWEHLPYIAGLKSCHRFATVSSSIRTFFRGSKLLTVAVLRPVAKTANLGSLMAAFWS